MGQSKTMKEAKNWAEKNNKRPEIEQLRESQAQFRVENDKMCES